MAPFAFSTIDAPNRRADSPVATLWLWQGFLAPGSITLLTGLWKCGKTSLVAALLAKLQDGGELAGLPVRPGRAVVVSEEAELHWCERSHWLNFGPNVRFMCRPFAGRPAPEQWQALIDFLAADRVAGRGLDLVVIDSLAAFLPTRNENEASCMLDALQPLRTLTTAGMSVLILHHPKKDASTPGQRARGSGVLSGFVDIVMEMTYHARPEDNDPRRRLMGFSRHPETPHRLLIERTADIANYRALGDWTTDDLDGTFDVLLSLLEAASTKLTRTDLLDRWPEPHPLPTEVTLWRWLEKAVADGRVLREGRGKRNQPFRYWLEGQELRWEGKET